MPAQDRALPVGDGAGEALELGHAAAVAVVVEAHEPLADASHPSGEPRPTVHLTRSPPRENRSDPIHHAAERP